MNMRNIVSISPATLLSGVLLSVCRGEPELAPTLDTELDGTNSVVYCPTLCVHQDVLFEMDETGAFVRSTAYGDVDWGGSVSPRQFVFDKPFLLTLWQKGAKQPYLAVWVASPDVLVPFREAKNAEDATDRILSTEGATSTQE